MSVDLGSVKKTVSEIQIEWTIPDFFSLPKETDYSFWSPDFNFLDSDWYLQIYPNGSGDSKTVGWIEVCLLRRNNASELSVSITLSLKAADGKALLKGDGPAVYSEKQYSWGTPRFYSRSELMKESSKLVPSGTLTIICSIRCHEPNSIEILKATDSAVKVHAAGVGKSTQTETGHLAETCDAIEEKIDLDALSQSFKTLLLDGDCHDVTLKVKEREFRAHQSILRARSQVFDSTLKHDMVEKNTGVITISDCDPAAFEQFLLYVYSGKVGTLDQNNMLGLYYIADKYDMPELKGKSREFVKKSLSSSIICDVIRLALNHSDSDLLSQGTDYFVKNINEILPTVEWQTFMKEYTIQANELIMKAAKNWSNSKA